MPLDVTAITGGVLPMSPNIIVERQEYVCGLLFSDYGGEVTLIEKQTPAWQAGKFNGVGGKVEDGEDPLSAMKREFLEEAGVEGVPWQHTATLTGPDFIVYFYHAFSTPKFLSTKTMEKERVLRLRTAGALVSDKLMSNLRVIIPLALDDSGIHKPVFLRDERTR